MLTAAMPRNAPAECSDATATERGSPLTPRTVFRENRWRILATYLLFSIENLLRLAQPFAVGLAINDLLVRSHRGLLILLAQHLSHMLIGMVRQMYDTRTFTSIYSKLASRVVLDQHAGNVDLSRIAARSTMAHSYVEFFERDMPLLIRASYSVVGALIMMSWYDWKLLPWCAALVVPALLLNSAYARRTLELNGRLHDELENEVDTISQADPDGIRSHYNAVATWRIRLSDAEAVNFSLMELFVLGLLLATLVQYCSNPGIAAGDIFAVFRYVMLFIMGLDAVPRLVQQVSRIRDVSHRIRRGRRPAGSR